MSDWIHDPFGSSEADPEFGLLPQPPFKDFLSSYLGLKMKFSWPLREVRDGGLRQRTCLAQRELCALHVQEQQRLLTEAARMVSHRNLSSEQRQRARAIWSGPLLTVEDWRQQCLEELACGREGRARTPQILGRMCQRELKDWPSAGDLMRAALHLRNSANLRLEFVRAAFVEGLKEGLVWNLEQLWCGVELGSAQRLSLLRSLAVLHEAAGECEKAWSCWRLIVGRDEDHWLAQLSCFSLAISTGDEVEARAVAQTISRKLVERGERPDVLRRAFRERAWIGRTARCSVTQEARDLRLHLLATGEPLLSELCLELV